jgi:hypothetical protein
MALQSIAVAMEQRTVQRGAFIVETFVFSNIAFKWVTIASF